MIDNAMSLWRWPFDAVQLAEDMIETIAGAQRVVTARLPVIEAAMKQPLTADHAELGRMVTEKIGAFGASGRSVGAAGQVVRRAAAANASALGRMAGGGTLWPADWLRLAETNLAAAAALASLPAKALAPVKQRVSANDKRLASRRLSAGRRARKAASAKR